MRKRRKRRSLNWGPILWLAVIGNCAAGLFYSPLTAVHKLRVEGSQLSDRARLVQLAQTLKDKPALALNPQEFESAVQKDSRMDTADFRRSIFGSAALKVRYRQAVARVDAEQNLYVDPVGSLFRTPEPPKNLPTLQLHRSALEPSLTLVGACPLKEIAQVIQGIPSGLLKKGITVEVDSEGAVCLNISQGTRIDLGGTNRFEEKLKKLEGLLQERPALLQEAQEINLTQPDHPTLRPRMGNKK